MILAATLEIPQFSVSLDERSSIKADHTRQTNLRDTQDTSEEFQIL